MDLTSKSRFQTFLAKRQVQQGIVIVTFSFIPLLLLATFTYLPFAKMMEFSLYKMKYIGPRTFIGLKNYRDVFLRTDTKAALLNSFYYMGAGVIQLTLALYFAAILSFKVTFEKFFKASQIGRASCRERV